MRMARAALLLLLAWATPAAGARTTMHDLQHDKDAVSDVETLPVTANGIPFDCYRAVSVENNGNIMFLHGFPEFANMYFKLMKKFQLKGFNSIACNQRGYSASGQPTDEADYDYDNLRDDIFEVAAEVGFDKFHLVTHDHGALLGFYAAGSSKGQEHIVSFTSMSIPHPDAFSEGLFGDNADEEQQAASQYFTMFAAPDSAKWLNLAKLPIGAAFKSQEEFQHALWWYNGAFSRGVLSGVPFMDAAQLEPFPYPWKKLRAALPPFQRPPPIWQTKGEQGFEQSVKIGVIAMPVLYICGNQDTFILCSKPFAKKTQDYCKSTYEYLEIDCGHDPMVCEDPAQTQAAEEAIMNFVETANR